MARITITGKNHTGIELACAYIVTGFHEDAKGQVVMTIRTSDGNLHYRTQDRDLIIAATGEVIRTECTVN